jgi:hypothetical protein
MATNDNRGREKPSDKPLEPWERYDYREMRPDLKRMISSYKFDSRFKSLLWRTAGVSGAVATLVYTFRDPVVRVVHALLGSGL